MVSKKLGFLLSILLSMFGTKALAYDIAVKNADDVTIYYNYINDGKELEVVYKTDNYNSYSGSVIIPEEVTIMNRTRKVTSIGDYAFCICSGLTSVTIGNNVTSIGERAFKYCSGLTSVTIGNSVTSIGDDAFSDCSGLISVTIPNSVTSIGNNAFRECRGLTSVTIGNSVTSIGDYAFFDCSGLTSITIGNSVTSIGKETFCYCSSLASVNISDIAAWCKITFSDQGNPLFYAQHLYLNGEEIKDLVIPNGVTSIGERAFYYCSGLTSVTIPNSVTSIGDHAFFGCSGLTSVKIFDIAAWCNIAFSNGSNPLYHAHHLYLNEKEIKDLVIPNSVTSIGGYAFSGCIGLTSVTIPNSVTSIGRNAFDGSDLPEVISKIENPFKINGKSSNSGTFSLNTFNNATLYVPVGTIDKYKATAGWKDFFFIEEKNGGGDTPSEPSKCEKPTITFKDGKLIFSCATEGVTYQYSITASDVKNGTGNEIDFTPKYSITVYAAKAGYENSDVATMEIQLPSDGGYGKLGDLNGDGVVDAADIVTITNIIMGE